MYCYILDPPRYTHALVTSGACLIAPGIRLFENPDNTQPHPYNLPFSGNVGAYADHIAATFADYTPGTRIVQSVGLLRSCSDIRWQETPHATEETITRGMIDGTWRCKHDVDMMDQLAGELLARHVEFDWLYSDWENRPDSTDPAYANMMHIWQQASGNMDPAAFDARALDVAAVTTIDLCGVVGWTKVKLIQPDRSYHFDQPRAGCFTTLHSIDDVPTFRGKMQAAHDAGCIGVLIDTAPTVTDAQLEAHRPAIEEFCQAGART